MPESIQHQELVERIIQWIKTENGEHTGLTILADTVIAPMPNRPSPIDGYYPDVDARTVPSSFTILGEAKSYADVFEDHTDRQITAFLRYLAIQSQPTFILAVPLAALGAGRSLVRRVQRSIHAHHVRTVFLYG